MKVEEKIEEGNFYRARIGRFHSAIHDDRFVYILRSDCNNTIATIFHDFYNDQGEFDDNLDRFKLSDEEVIRRLNSNIIEKEQVTKIIHNNGKFEIYWGNKLYPVKFCKLNSQTK